MSMLAIERINATMDKIPLVTDKRNSLKLEYIKNNIIYKNVGFEYLNRSSSIKRI